jgi:hypothetical protein
MDVPDINMSPTDDQDEPEALAKPNESQAGPAVKFTD